MAVHLQATQISLSVYQYPSGEVIKKPEMQDPDIQGFAYKYLFKDIGINNALKNRHIEQLPIHTSSAKYALIVLTACGNALKDASDDEYDSLLDKIKNARVIISDPDQKGDYTVSFYSPNYNGAGFAAPVEGKITKQEHDIIEIQTKDMEGETPHVSSVQTSEEGAPSVSAKVTLIRADRFKKFNPGGEYHTALKNYVEYKDSEVPSSEFKDKAKEAFKEYAFKIFGVNNIESGGEVPDPKEFSRSLYNLAYNAVYPDKRRDWTETELSDLEGFNELMEDRIEKLTETPQTS